jgi:hypothetical protein
MKKVSIRNNKDTLHLRKNPSKIQSSQHPQLLKAPDSATTAKTTGFSEFSIKIHQNHTLSNKSTLTFYFISDQSCSTNVHQIPT